MNELNKLYKAMLISWGGVIKEDSRIVFTIGGSKDEIPIRIDDMDLYLPTSEVLENNCIGKVFFHPACENIQSKETEIFKIIRKMTTMRLLDAFRRYPAILVSAAGREKKAWRQDVLDMMEPLKSVKRNTLAEVNTLFARMAPEVDDDGVDNRFIHFKVIKGGGRSQRTGERVYYKTKPVFPFYNAIAKRLAHSEGQADNQLIELNGSSVSRGALKLAHHLFQSILPAVLDPDGMEFESFSSVAARLVSYLGCYGELAEQMNRVQNTFRAEFDKGSVYPIELGWLEHMEDLPEIWRQVPALDYNSHNTYEEGVNSNNTQNLSGLMSVSSSNSNNNNQQQNNQQQNNNNNQFNNNNQMQQLASQNGFDTTVPPMQPGDRWVKTDIDINNNKVLHHAVTIAGLPVIYMCTRQGNLLQRNEGNAMMGMGGMGMMPGMMPGMGMPGMGMPGMGMGMPGMMMMMPNGQMMQMQQPVTASAAGGGHHYSTDMNTSPATY